MSMEKCKQRLIEKEKNFLLFQFLKKILLNILEYGPILRVRYIEPKD